MSNYPPGVTGNEPQIAGYPEGEREVRCDNMCDAWKIRIVAAGVATELDRALVLPPVNRSKREFKLDGDEIECPFRGKVDGAYVDWEFVASCPLCGNEIREDLPEVDEGYERALAGDPNGGEGWA